MTAWVKTGGKVLVIDGCFMSCPGKVLKNLIDKEKIINAGENPLYREYSDFFLYTDVPEGGRIELAR
jgi:hypothetical protein